MADRSGAPDHVFREELASFEDAPAWDAPTFTATRARLHILDGEELGEPIEVRSIDLRLNRVSDERLGELLARAVEDARQLRHVMATIGCGPDLAAAVVRLADREDLDLLTNFGADVLVDLALDAAAELRPGDRWLADAIRAAATFDAAMVSTMAALGVTPEQVAAWAGEVRNAYAEPRSLLGGLPVVETPDVSVPTLVGRESWERSWDGEPLAPGCIADTEDSLDGGDYIPCCAPTEDGWDWCPTHLAAIRARAEDPADDR